MDKQYKVKFFCYLKNLLIIYFSPSIFLPAFTISGCSAAVRTDLAHFTNVYTAILPDLKFAGDSVGSKKYLFASLLRFLRTLLDID